MGNPDNGSETLRKVEEFIKRSKMRIDDYVKSLWATISLMILARECGGECFLRPKLRTDQDKRVTPDLLIHIRGEYAVGELKSSLPNPEGLSELENDRIVSKIIGQLEKYDRDIREGWLTNYQLFLLIQGGLHKFQALLIEMLEGIKNQLTHGLSIINYFLHKRRSDRGIEGEMLVLSLSYGQFKGSAFKEFQRKLQSTFSVELPVLHQRMNEIFLLEEEVEDYLIPFVLVQFYLKVLPKSYDILSDDSLLRMRNEGKIRIEFSFDELYQKLAENFFISSHDGRKIPQFSKSLLRKILRLLVKLKLADELSRDGKEYYVIYWKPLRVKDPLDYFTRKYAKEKFGKILKEEKTEVKFETLEKWI
ncbi:MAG: hypothetical protein QI223_03020 [Candidatus Korarchaeota archaeon]|nr:hypothetical protein [Candidatus Korarchaeota archaeon]